MTANSTTEVTPKLSAAQKAFRMAYMSGGERLFEIAEDAYEENMSDGGHTLYRASEAQIVVTNRIRETRNRAAAAYEAATARQADAA